jgi:hypothetical protein
MDASLYIEWWDANIQIYSNKCIIFTITQRWALTSVGTIFLSGGHYLFQRCVGHICWFLVYLAKLAVPEDCAVSNGRMTRGWRIRKYLEGIGCSLNNALNAELNTICHLQALLGAHHILHVSRTRVNVLPRHFAGDTEEFHNLRNRKQKG